MRKRGSWKGNGAQWKFPRACADGSRRRWAVIRSRCRVRRTTLPTLSIPAREKILANAFGVERAACSLVRVAAMRIECATNMMQSQKGMTQIQAFIVVRDDARRVRSLTNGCCVCRVSPCAGRRLLQRTTNGFGANRSIRTNRTRAVRPVPYKMTKVSINHTFAEDPRSATLDKTLNRIEWQEWAWRLLFLSFDTATQQCERIGRGARKSVKAFVNDRRGF